MLPQISNNVFGSSILWMDHLLCNVGQGYFNVGTRFYPTNQIYNNYYAYAAPFKQIVYDYSVSGASMPSGIYVNSSFITPGTSGFAGFNFDEGLALFTGNQGNNVISGNYAVKQFAINSITEEEEYILIEKKYTNKNLVGQVFSGLYSNQQPYPVIYARNVSQNNDPFALGGEKNTKNLVRFTILADNNYNLDSVASLIADQEEKYVPLLQPSESPINPFGGPYLTGWSYLSVISGKIGQNQSSFISKVDSLSLSSQLLSKLKDIDPKIYLSIIELNLETIRFTTNHVRYC